MKARRIPVSEDIEAAFTSFTRAIHEHLSKCPIPQLSTKENNAMGKAYWAYLKLIPEELWEVISVPFEESGEAGELK